MAWIESHQDLATNRKTARAARLLDVPVPQVIGHLHMLWWWALDHAFDGDLSDFDALDVADVCGWDGEPDRFVDALVECGPGGKAGFLDREGDRLTIHDWDQFTEHLRARREASAKAHHERWHVNRNIVEPSCDLCANGDGSQTSRGADGDEAQYPDDANAMRTQDERTAPEPEPGPTGTEPNPTEPSTTSDDPDVADEARQLTRYFAQAILDNGHPLPGKGSRARDTWLIEMDRLLRLGPPGEGGHIPDPDEVRHVIDFATTDDFWAANIQSVPTFRRKFAQLRLKAASNGQPSKGSDYAARYEAAAEQLERQGR